MVSSRANERAKRRPPTMHDRRRKAAAALATLSAVHMLNMMPSITNPPQPMHTSILTGQKWVEELLEGHPKRFYESMGMARKVFLSLVGDLRKAGLRDSKYVTGEEQVAIFLRLVIYGAGTREASERFQRSQDTISKSFHRILRLLCTHPFYHTYVRLPDADIPDIIEANPKYAPFKDALAAVDGTLIDAWGHEEDHGRLRSRKGKISQNILAATTFDLRICYIMTGWEGSTADGRLWEAARAIDLTIPAGKYWLADAGFPHCDLLLVPYRNVRYHLKEWAKGNQRPANAKELFNLRHAQLRNAVERVFGVMKRRYRILRIAPEYPMAVQAMIPCALSALHNYIRIHDPREHESLDLGDEVRYDPRNAPDEETFDEHTYNSTSVPLAERNRADARRDRIAQELWEDYQQYLAEQ